MKNIFFTILLLTTTVFAATKSLQGANWYSNDLLTLWTPPGVSDTLLGVSATQNAANKTISSSVFSGGTVSASTLAGTLTLSGVISGGTVSGSTFSNGTLSNSTISGTTTLGGVVNFSGVLHGGTVSNTTITGQSVADFDDNKLSIRDNVDVTKILQLQLSGITTGTTRTLTAPNDSGEIMCTSCSQTTYNKNHVSSILTSPSISGTMTGGTISGTTLAGSITLSSAIVSGTATLGGTITNAGNITGGTLSSSTIAGATMTNTGITGGSVSGTSISSSTFLSGSVSDTTVDVNDSSGFTLNHSGGKRVRFNIDTAASNTTLVFSYPSTSSDTIATLASNQAFTAVKSFSSAIDLTSGQIDFPSSQNASSGANTLDDFEEGTCTPTYQGITSSGTTTYSVQRCDYLKVGRRVGVDIYVNWSTITGTGGAVIAGFPYPSTSANANYRSACAIGYADGISAAANTFLGAVVGVGVSHASLQVMTASGTTSAATMDGGGLIMLHCDYMSAN